VSDATTRQRRTAYFSGRVQGVGFRFTTVRIAREFAVEGFVRNLDDGRVLVVAEGEPGELDRFFTRLQEEMAYNIRQASVSPGPTTGEFAGFAVRY
jgi:acylphosphatase